MHFKGLKNTQVVRVVLHCASINLTRTHLRGSMNCLYLSARCAQAVVTTGSVNRILMFFFIIILQVVNRHTITNLLPGTSYKLEVIDFPLRT